MLQYQRGEEFPHKLKQKISQITQDKIFRGAMNISDIATVRTGLVKARKEKNNSSVITTKKRSDRTDSC